MSVERMRAYGRNICEGVAAYVQDRGVDWSLEFVDTPPSPPTHTCGRTRLSDYDGFIVRVMNDATAAHIRRTRRPAVDVFCKKVRPGFVGVDADHVAIAQMAGRYFLDRKFANYAFCGYDGVRYSDERRDAFVRYLRNSHCDCICFHTPREVMMTFDDDVICNEKVGLDVDAGLLMQWLKDIPKPCALFCCHDLRAYQVIELCRRTGISVPGEIAVLGVDDDRLLCSFVTPKISSVDPDAFRIGWTAAETLDRMLCGEAVSAKCGFIGVPPKDIVTRASTEVYPYAPAWLSDALVFIRKNVERSVNASDVIRHVGRSHTLVERTFKKVLGTTLQRAIVESRIAEAEHILTTSELPVREVGARCGFKSSQYFCRTFMSFKGLPPQMFREKNARSSSRGR